MWIVDCELCTIRKCECEIFAYFAEDWMREISCVLCFPYICLRYFLLSPFPFFSFLWFCFSFHCGSFWSCSFVCCGFANRKRNVRRVVCVRCMAAIMAMGNGWFADGGECVFLILQLALKETGNVNYISDSIVTRIGYLYGIVNCKNVNLLFVLFCWSGTEYWILNAGWWLNGVIIVVVHNITICNRK